MKILVTGDRYWLKPPEIERLLEEGENDPSHERVLEMMDEIKAIQQSRVDFIYDVLDSFMDPDDPPIIVEGEALGVDTVAKEWAIRSGVEFRPYPANWDKYGKSAGPIRNQQMYNEESPDLILAFHPDIDNSRGTKNMVDYARSKGFKAITVYTGRETD